MQYGHSVVTTTMANNSCTTAQIGGVDHGLKALCSVAAITATGRSKTDAIQMNCNNLSVRALTSITHSSNATALKKLERKTAKVAPLAPIARKSNIAAAKKTYPTVLPKKHVYIAPRTSNVIDATKSSTTPNMLATSVKRAELMQHQHHHHHPHHHPHHHQPHQPHEQKAGILQSKLPPPNAGKPSVMAPSASKLNGSVYQLHPAPAMPKLVQIPSNLVGSAAAAATATKEANAPAAANNLVINNGTTHYFLNGTVIKLQQMSTPQQVNKRWTSTHFFSIFNLFVIILTSSFSLLLFASRRMNNIERILFCLCRFSIFLRQDSHALTTHNDLTTHFAAVGPSAAPFGQPLFMATSSGLLLTATLPTMLTSHQLTNLPTQLAQHQQMPALHQFNQPTSHGNLTANLHAAQFLNHNNFPSFAVATATANHSAATPSSANATHFVSKSNAALLANIPLSTKPSPPLLTMQTSIVSATATVASTSTSQMEVAPIVSTPMAIIKPQNNFTPTPTMATITPIAASCVQSKTNCTKTELLLNCSNTNNTNNTLINNNNNKNNQQKSLPIVSSTSATTMQSAGNPISILIAKQDVTIELGSCIDAGAYSDSNKMPSPIKSVHHQSISSMPIGGNLVVPVMLTATKLPQPSLPSPKSALLENIQQKKLDDMFGVTVAVFDSTSITSTPRLLSPLDAFKRPTTVETDFLASTALIECSKSPILSQPKTIRFPANDSRHGTRRTDNRMIGCCYWDGCNAKCESSSNLLDHLQTQHVNSQAGPFTCRWANCKVHGRESCSRKWLERHVLSHGGSKFFKCIFDKCRLRFGSQVSATKLYSTV